MPRSRSAGLPAASRNNLAVVPGLRRERVERPWRAPSELLRRQPATLRNTQARVEVVDTLDLPREQAPREIRHPAQSGPSQRRSRVRNVARGPCRSGSRAPPPCPRDCGIRRSPSAAWSRPAGSQPRSPGNTPPAPACSPAPARRPRHVPRSRAGAAARTCRRRSPAGRSTPRSATARPAGNPRARSRPCGSRRN